MLGTVLYIFSYIISINPPINLVTMWDYLINMEPEHKHPSFHNITLWSGNRDEGEYPSKVDLFILLYCWNFKESMHMLVY